ncbi:MAG TPA: type 4a pilus biogenesis protein PilO [Kofleriaceae bacterium]|nr:type 4a pilus biogenesis protein PilO [Kofleriaceae bacterium]
MARSDAAGGLRSPKAQVALVALLAVGLGLVYWQMVYGPMQDDEKRLTSGMKKLEEENKSLIEEERIQSDMEKCRVELDGLNRDNELMLPAEAEPVAFLKNLSNMAATSGLEQGPTKMLAEATVQAPPPRPEDKRKADERKKAGKGAMGEQMPCWEKIPGLQADPAAKATFVRVPFVIEVRGTFHQLMRYFWMVHEHANAGRIMTVEDLSLSAPRAGVDGITMSARFVAVGFREPDESQPAEETETAAPPKGGRAVVRDATQKRESQVEAAANAGGESTTTGPGAAQPAAQPAQPAQGGEPARPADPAASGINRITRPEAAQ